MQAATLASTQLLLSALLGFEECLAPGPKHVLGSWSKPGFSCSACLLGGCRAERRRVGAEDPAGDGGGDAGGSLALASSASKEQLDM